MADHHGTSDLRERPTSELLRQLSDQTTALVRQEIELAKLEFRAKGKKAGMGAGMFGGAGVLGLYAVGALTATIILALATFLPAWVAALIVTVVYAAIAGVLALRGKSQVKEATPPMPEQAVETTKEDVRWVKTRAQSAREH
jgi:Putative Actinobacterial Holin-X, holin superfamily III